MTGKPGRPKIYASPAERQAVYKKNRHVRSVALGKYAQTIDSIAKELDRPASEVIESLLRFALVNRNWKMTGLLPRNGEKPLVDTEEN